jgi:hypothetical protein
MFLGVEYVLVSGWETALYTPTAQTGMPDSVLCIVPKNFLLVFKAELLRGRGGYDPVTFASNDVHARIRTQRGACVLDR